jgi:hypothetical protein
MNGPPQLTPGQRRGLCKAGDVLIPGDGEFPSFSAAGCADQIARMLPHMNDGDRRALLLLLGLFRCVPRVLLRFLFTLTANQRRFPEPLGAPLRLIDIGVKGVVMTLYYSDVGTGPSIHDLIRWDARVVERD